MSGYITLVELQNYDTAKGWKWTSYISKPVFCWKMFVISNKTRNIDLTIYRNTTAVSENYVFLAEEYFWSGVTTSPEYTPSAFNCVIPSWSHDEIHISLNDTEMCEKGVQTASKAEISSPLNRERRHSKWLLLYLVLLIFICAYI